MLNGVRYRLYMESKGTLSEDFVSKWWDPNGVTIIPASGYWLGKYEDTIIVEICFEDSLSSGIPPAEQIKTFCAHYNEKFNQDCILVTSEPITMELM